MFCSTPASSSKLCGQHNTLIYVAALKLPKCKMIFHFSTYSLPCSVERACSHMYSQSQLLCLIGPNSRGHYLTVTFCQMFFQVGISRHHSGQQACHFCEEQFVFSIHQEGQTIFLCSWDLSLFGQVGKQLFLALMIFTCRGILGFEK